MSRQVLSEKSSNVSSPSTKWKSRSSSSSPLKGSPSKRSKLSPYKYINRSDSSIEKPSGPGFVIFQDKLRATTAEFNDLDIDGKENPAIISKEKTSNDQENILQPKIKTLTQSAFPFRKPLSNLSMADFPGFVTVDSVATQLTEPFFSKYENTTAHKFQSLPSYVSPAKSNSRYLFKSNAKFNEDDELESNLYRKSVLIGHKRSFSMGKNDLKHSLIKKNDFTILTN